MRKYSGYIILSLFLVYLIIVLTFVEHSISTTLCRDIYVDIDHDENAFVSAIDICDDIEQRYGSIVNKQIKHVNTDSLELLLNKSPMIKAAQVAYSLDGNFHINIIQRKPLLRVVAGWDGYYIDESGCVMPLSSQYTSKVVPVTGVFPVEFAQQNIFPLVQYINNDSFWKHYIDQIVVDSRLEILVVPKVGDFIVRLGGIEEFQSKLNKFKLFLDKGINHSGWNRYQEINLKYENQVVCVKK